jgi:hypothetical protein
MHTAQGDNPYSVATIAWYSNRDDALDDIEKNAGDMHECYYDYLILEEVEEFQMPSSKVVAWFHWEQDSWTECDLPKAFEGVVNWSMG